MIGMKNMLGVILLLCIVQLNVAQLNCITRNDENRNKITTCFHKNGKISTVTTWDANHREGSIYGLNASGQKIFEYDLRTFAGHASVYLSYYANGQVKKAEYSSAPDGGIQFWQIIREFDENGNQTSYIDLSEPDGHPVLIAPTDSSIKPYVYQQPEEKPQLTPFTTIFELVNETPKTLTVQLKATHNLVHDTLVTLKPHQNCQVVIVNQGQKFLEAGAYQPQTKFGKIKKEKYKYILAQPAEVTYTRTYTWHILKK
jgi:hypothetical protein